MLDIFGPAWLRSSLAAATSVMQKCFYCGQENDEKALKCFACGTPFEASPSEVSPQSSKAQWLGRPKGVWIASVWVGVFAGLWPLVVGYIIRFGPTPSPDLIPTPQFVLFTLLALTSIGLAAGALLQQSWARYGLVVAALVHWGGVAWNNYVLATDGEFGNDMAVRFWVQAAKSTVTPAVIGWYLIFGKSAREFFSHRAQ
jgi:hypothetical protein